MTISKIKKRDGTIVRFNIYKIANAIEKAMSAIGMTDDTLSYQLAEKVHMSLNSQHPNDYIPSVEELQDLVEKVIMNEGQTQLAKSYILYRQKRAEIRKIKQDILGRLDDSKLSVNGLLLARSRYLARDSQGNTLETPREMFARVAKAAAKVEKTYGKSDQDIEDIEEAFTEAMTSLEFVPGGRILANAGRKKGMLYSSFVLPIPDSMKGIFRTLYYKALIQREGGGTGFSFSRLRPRGRKLSASLGYASGPVAFIKLFDYASDLTVKEGSRKAANMGSLSVEHPDIVEFITMKERRELRNFNISVELTDEFMEAVNNHTNYKIRDSQTGRTIEEVDAGNIFQLIVTMAWKTGDPGVLFIDKINRSNPLPDMGRIETTDPCGDQLLLPFEGGHLGAINLSQFVRNKKIKWKQLDYTTKLAVRFLDNIIDISSFPVKKTEEVVRGSRRLGLGLMGFADMLYKLGISYDSDKGLETAEKLIKYISTSAYEASKDLANERGVFPYWSKSIYANHTKIRNSSILAVSPTGSRSVLADTSPGIEPNFALGFTRKILGSTEIIQVNKVLEETLKQYDAYNDESLRKVIKYNSVEDIKELPADIKKIFVTAHNISPIWHVKMQAVFQKNIDNAISKTINFPRTATIEDIKTAFLNAYALGCKGITVYREGSLPEEVITVGG